MNTKPKNCKDCGIEQNLENTTIYKSYFQSYCKQCRAKRRIKYAEKNREKVREQYNKYSEKNREKLRELRRKWKEKNRVKVKETKKRWIEKNREKVREHYKKWKEENREKAREYSRKWNKENREYHNVYLKNRKKSDPLFKLKCDIRSHVNRFIKGGKSKRTEEILGCTFEFLYNRFNNMFHSGMTWDNHGTLWEIEHTIPLMTAKTNEEVYKLNHYTNLTPMLKTEHKVKTAKDIIKYRGDK